MGMHEVACDALVGCASGLAWEGRCNRLHAYHVLRLIRVRVRVCLTTGVAAGGENAHPTDRVWTPPVATVLERA
jgi:hypothetical protein